MSGPPFVASGRSAFHDLTCVRCQGHASFIQWWRPYCGVCLTQIADANGGKYPVKEPAR
jgi:ribosomal protein S27E